MTPPLAAFSPTLQVQLQVVSESPHTFAYKLWVGRPTDRAWQPLGDGDIHTGPQLFGPFPTGTEIDYCILNGGNPNTTWKTQVVLSQGGSQLTCSPPADIGTTDDKGVGSVENVLTLQ